MDTLLEKKDRLNKLANEILKEEEKIAGEKAKHLIGKCYKYLNSYSGSEKWWLYVKIISSDKHGWFRAEKIQRDCDKKIIYEPSDLLHSFDGDMLGSYISISPRTYENAKHRIANYINEAIDWTCYDPAKTTKGKAEEKKAKVVAKRLVDSVMGKEKKNGTRRTSKSR